METMNRYSRALSFFAIILSSTFACGDDAISTESSDSEATTQTTDTEASTSTDIGPPIDMSPWHSRWYVSPSEFPINELVPWINGGSSLYTVTFELDSEGATIQTNSCIFGSEEYRYAGEWLDSNRLELIPVGGAHEYEPAGELEALYVDFGDDCAVLTVVQRTTDGQELDLFGGKGYTFHRGELCLDSCAENDGEYGRVTDCGVSVPWACDN